MFLNAVPQSTGTTSPATVRVAHRATQVVGGDLLVADVLLEHVLVELAHDVDELVTPRLGVGLRASAGMSTVS